MKITFDLALSWSPFFEWQSKNESTLQKMIVVMLEMI